jgi:hypothetical protein
MAANLTMDSATLIEVLAKSAALDKVLALTSALGTGTQTVSIKDGVTEKLTGTFAGTAYGVDGPTFLPNTTLSSVSGAGGTAGAGWTCRITSANGRWVQGAFGTGEPFLASGALSSSGTTTLRVELVGSAMVAVPPAAVTQWIVFSTDTSVTVPTTFIGVHSDYIDGFTRPVAEPGYQSFPRTVRSLNHYPDLFYGPTLSWAGIERTQGVYTWTDMDRWVSQHTGNKLIWVIDRTPSFYCKYTTANSLYGSSAQYQNSSSPPTDYTKAADIIEAILNRYPSEDWVFELHNEVNFGYTTEGGGAITVANMYSTRWSDAYSSQAAYFIGTATDMAEGARVIKQTLTSRSKTITLIAAGWEGMDNDALTNSLRRFMTCPTTGGGTGKDWVDGNSWHSYTYGGTNGYKIVAEGVRYKAMFNTYCPGVPHWSTETGNFGTYSNGLTDTQSSDNIIRWYYAAAALGAQTLCLYRIDSGNEQLTLHLKYWAQQDTAAKLATNNAYRAAVATAAAIRGKTISQAAHLVDNRIWLAFSDGTTVVR